MFDVFLDFVKRLLKSRLFPIAVVYLLLFAVIINRLFVLQIIQGPSIDISNDLKEKETREIKSTRGNIYDCKGVLLASNKLSYSVVMEDITTSNTDYNAIIYKLINLIEKNGDTLDTEFYIKQNDNGQFEFTTNNSNTLTRFKEYAYAFVLEDDELTQEQIDSSAKDVYDFLRNGTGDNYTHMFGISDEYSVEDTLKIMSVRYALFSNYPKYLQITVASTVSDSTVAAVKESSAELPGVEIQQQTSRVYEESVYFAHILGYTGKISAAELEKYEAKGYSATDVIGKTGLEQKLEEDLAGTKGIETVTVNGSGRVLSVDETKDPIAGNDIYLTIDSEQQKYYYLLLEKEITKTLLESIVSDMNYGSKGESAGEIKLPIYEVYNALINNNIIDINAFTDSDATVLEKETYSKYQSALKDVFAQMDALLSLDSATTNDKAGDLEKFLDYFYDKLKDQKILSTASIPKDDDTYNSYLNDKISLSKFLQYALANNWIDLSALKIGDEYYSEDELYEKLISTTKELLQQDDIFNKLIYRNLVFSYKLSGTEICLLLFDQGMLKYNEDDISRLKNNNISAYDFMINKITSSEITPGMLALDPCSGTVIATDPKTGEVKAMVTYPSYDNNMLANKVDSDYYTMLLNNESYPLINNALASRVAPGSTYKIVSSVAALEEGVTTPTEKIRDLGVFDKIARAAKCHIFPGSHGSVDIVDALKVSCNYFFYEMGWRLSIDSAGLYKPEIGLAKLAKYATLFGLNEESGIELDEATPEISDIDAVRSAIGQGTNYFTPAQLSRYVTTIANRGTCYNLTLVDKIEDKNGTVTHDNSATVSHTLSNIKSSTWDAVYEGMYSVVNEYGGSVYSEFNGFDVTIAGKTGTSQVSTLHPNNALFLSFAPYNDPEISVTVVIPRGFTSHNAARLTKNIYSLYFKLEDAQTLLDNYLKESSGTGSALE